MLVPTKELALGINKQTKLDAIKKVNARFKHMR